MFDPAVIYLRTPLGRATAFNPTSPLPELPKTVLRTVDGKMSAEAVVMQLSSLGDVEKSLSQLEQLGLIADRNAVLPKVRYQRSSEEGTPQFVDTNMPLLEASSSIFQIEEPEVVDMLATTSFAAKPSSAQSSAPKAQWSDTTPSVLDELPAPVYSLWDRMAQQTADEMCTFVLTHLPAQAFGLLSVIEEIKTPDQLKSYMPRYVLELADLGPKGQTHLDEVQQVLRKLF
jgi:hypothetical protein